MNRRADRGDTLIEILMTVTIMGIAGVALFSAVLGSVQGSTFHRQQAQAQGLLRTWAEQIATSTYMVCATPTANAYAAPPAMPAGFTAPKITQVRYWRPDPTSTATPKPSAWLGGSGVGGACVASDDNGAQKVTIQVSSTNPKYVGVTSTLDVVVIR